MQTTIDRYTEHSRAEAHGFDVVDATPSAHHNDQIWVGIYGEGRWLTAHEALGLAATIERAASAQLERLRKTPALPYGGPFTPLRTPSFTDLRDDYPWGADGHFCGKSMDAPDHLPAGSHRALHAGGHVIADGYHGGYRGAAA